VGRSTGEEIDQSSMGREGRASSGSDGRGTPPKLGGRGGVQAGAQGVRVGARAPALVNLEWRKGGSSGGERDGGRCVEGEERRGNDWMTGMWTPHNGA